MSEEPAIRVKDNRRFTADGDAKPDAPEEKQAAAAPPPEPEPATSEAEASSATKAAPKAEVEPEANAAPEPDPQQFAPPPASLELLVYSLVMQAEMSLMGESDEKAPNLPMARHAIDMLGVLKDKTKGNLSLEENRLLENSLTELRFRYVQIQGEFTRPGGGS